MTTKELLLQKIESMSETQLTEMLTFAQTIQEKSTYAIQKRMHKTSEGRCKVSSLFCDVKNHI